MWFSSHLFVTLWFAILPNIICCYNIVVDIQSYQDFTIFKILIMSRLLFLKVLFSDGRPIVICVLSNLFRFWLREIWFHFYQHMIFSFASSWRKIKSECENFFNKLEIQRSSTILPIIYFISCKFYNTC